MRSESRDSLRAELDQVLATRSLRRGYRVEPPEPPEWLRREASETDIIRWQLQQLRRNINT